MTFMISEAMTFLTSEDIILKVCIMNADVTFMAIEYIILTI